MKEFNRRSGTSRQLTHRAIIGDGRCFGRQGQTFLNLERMQNPEGYD